MFNSTFFALSLMKVNFMNKDEALKCGRVASNIIVGCMFGAMEIIDWEDYK